MGLGKAAGRRAASTEQTQVDSGLQPLPQPRLQWEHVDAVRQLWGFIFFLEPLAQPLH